MFSNIKSIFSENEEIISLFDNKVYINNFLNIIHLSDSMVLVKFIDKFVKIEGEEIVVRRLLEKEILLSGKIRRVTIDE